MFEILALIVFVWLFFGAVRIAFKVTWGLAKVVAGLLFVIALPSLIACLLFASGVVLLVPVALMGAAFGILRACI